MSIKNIFQIFLISIVCIAGIWSACMAQYFGFYVNGDRVMVDYEGEIITQESSWLGIPEPDFGLDEVYTMYSSEPNQNPDVNYYASPDAGYFTHYVDYDDPNATDTSNEFGSVATPRKTIPEDLGPGSIVEVHNDTNFASQYSHEPNGSATYPIFIRGVGDPNICSSTIVKGQYVIYEGFRLYDQKISIRVHNGSSVHHAVVRDCNFVGPYQIESNDAAAGASGASGNLTHDIVFYNNSVSYFGVWDANQENDYHGFNVGAYCYDIWILGNELHHLGGDSIQCGGNANFTCHNIYIAGNTMHNNYEDGVDLKESEDVVCSQNTVHDMANGAALFVHYGPNNISFIFNRVYDNHNGIGSTECNSLLIAGNVFDNVKGDVYGDSPPTIYQDGRSVFAYTTDNIGIFANTVYDTDMGIALLLNSGDTAFVANNIVMDANDTDGWAMLMDGSGIADCNNEYNLIYDSVTDVNIYWDDTTYETVAAWIAAKGNGTGSIEQDPNFTDTTDFDLDSESPFLNLTTSSFIAAKLTAYETRYGISIADEIAAILDDGTQYAPDK